MKTSNKKHYKADYFKTSYFKTMVFTLNWLRGCLQVLNEPLTTFWLASTKSKKNTPSSRKALQYYKTMSGFEACKPMN